MKRIFKRGLTYKVGLQTGNQELTKEQQTGEGTQRDCSWQGRHAGSLYTSFSTRGEHKRTATDSGTFTACGLFGGRCSDNHSMNELHPNTGSRTRPAPAPENAHVQARPTLSNPPWTQEHRTQRLSRPISWGRSPASKPSKGRGGLSHTRQILSLYLSFLSSSRYTPFRVGRVGHGRSSPLKQTLETFWRKNLCPRGVGHGWYRVGRGGGGLA